MVLEASNTLTTREIQTNTAQSTRGSLQQDSNLDRHEIIDAHGYERAKEDTRTQEERNEGKIPALQDVGGSFCKSLSSFKILLDAIGNHLIWEPREMNSRTPLGI